MHGVQCLFFLQTHAYGTTKLDVMLHFYFKVEGLSK